MGCDEELKLCELAKSGAIEICKKREFMEDVRGGR